MRLALLSALSLVFVACSAGRMGEDGGAPPDAGALADGGTVKLTAQGGTLADLRFAVVGDTRPKNADDNANYPTAVITQIYKDLAMVTAPPLFAVSTGDYQYVTSGQSTSATNADIQIGDYLGAAANFAGALFPAMGNHECTGYTDSECGPSGNDGLTDNYKTFLSKMLAPLGVATPYYSVPLRAADGSWTAKIVVTAANAWDSTQSDWLTQTMGQATTYTFVIRHEPSEDAARLQAIGDIDTILGGFPYTLLIVGHTHTFEHSTQSVREVIVGNGGVPGTRGTFGFAMVSRQGDGSIKVEQYDETSAAPTPNGVSFTVNAAGQPAN